MKAKTGKRLLLQGATGSIGSSAVSVVREQKDRFEFTGLAVRSNLQAALSLCEEFRPISFAIQTEISDPERDRLRSAGVREIHVGKGAAESQARSLDYDVLVNALSGSAGYDPTVAALERGIDVALANKETLVAAGPLVQSLAVKTGARIIPVDSEHSAILQCLAGETHIRIRKIWLTSSGGPFWGRKWSTLDSVTMAEALAHPTWKMGAKITIDSATLFNKGLEIIEAARLFGVDPEQIGVVVHRQSIVHSMVEFVDGSMKAQLSVPDMRLPLLYALSFPDRHESRLVQSGISNLRNLTFEELGSGEFPCVDLAYGALARGGTAPAAISAADEIAVSAFLNGRIRFSRIADVIAAVLKAWPEEELSSFEVLHAADARARALALSRVDEIRETKECLTCC